MNVQGISRCIFYISIVTKWMPQVVAVFHLTILHHNDIHAHFGIVDRFGNPCYDAHKKKCYGGFARAVHYVKDRRENDKFSKNLLVVNPGDFYQGTQYYSVFKWRIVADMVKRMNYTALALGNAEFADGIDGLMPFLRKIGDIFVCTNIDFSRISNDSLREELQRICPRHRIISYDAKKVCILGYTTPMTANIAQVTDVAFEDEVEALTKEVRAVRQSYPDVKIFVALGHSGYARDREVAHQVPSLDVIVGGHSHSLLWPNIRNKLVAGIPEDKYDTKFAQDVYPTIVTQPSGRTVLVVHMYKNGKYFGVLNVTFSDNDEVSAFFTSPLLLTDKFAEDAETLKVYQNYSAAMRLKQNEVIGRALVTLVGGKYVCGQAECNLGNLVSDAVLWRMRHYTDHAPRTMITLLNGGSMKTNITRGSVTMFNIVQALPYQNTVDVVELTGKAIREVLEISVAAQLPSGGFLQMSGIRVRYNMGQPVGQRVETVCVVCEECGVAHFRPLNDTAAYNVALTTFIVNGGDNYTIVRERAISITPRHELDLDIVISYIREFSPVHSGLDGRIQIVNESSEINIASGLYEGRWQVSARLVLPVALFMFH